MRIVGGGIGGLTAAIALAHKGLSVEVYEQAAQFEAVGAGIQMSPNALSVLFALGLREQLAPFVVEPRRIELWDGLRHRKLNHVPLGADARQAFGCPYWLIHRADLHKVLLDACTTHPEISLHLGARMEPGADKGPTVAADGVNSVWRTWVRGPNPSRYSGSTAWRVTTKGDGPTDCARVWFGPSAHLVEYPVRGGEEHNLVAIVKAPENTPIEVGFRHWDQAVLKRLRSIEGWSAWPLRTVDPNAAWLKGEIALLGDAAHGMVPFAAQGAAMAIEDAWVLAHCLAAQPRIEPAFQAYEAARRSRVSRVWQTAQTNGHIYHMSGPPAFARNQVLKVSRPEALRNRYHWIYSWKAENAAPRP